MYYRVDPLGFGINGRSAIACNISIIDDVWTTDDDDDIVYLATRLHLSLSIPPTP